MPKVLVVTNDFPPTVGGIQSYVRDFLAQLPAEDVIVFASTQDATAAAVWDQSAPYRVVRWPHKVMLPSPGVAREMKRLIAANDIHAVWFAAAAPLAVLAPVARAAGAHRVVASTHGHEVGWSMFPTGRRVLRHIGKHCDAVTYISSYTLNRLTTAFGEGTTWVRLPSGVDAGAYRRPTPAQQSRTRDRFGLGNGTVVTCVSRLVSRKGQDTLIRVWSQVTQRYPDARLVIVGEGAYGRRLRAMAREVPEVVFTGRVSDEERGQLLGVSDVFAMPVRTRGGGLDVEGLGIVFLEAQAAGVPVVVGDSGGAPETVTPDTGLVVSGRSDDAVTAALLKLLGDPGLRARMGDAGRQHVRAEWTWERLGRQLQTILFSA